MTENNFNDPSNLIILHNSRLRLSILKPGKAYMGPRFDWTGFITEVCLDNAHYFSASFRDPSTNVILGQGLCNEFGMNTPVGNKEESVDGHFPKIGIGLLPQGTDTMSPVLPSDTITPYDISYVIGDSQVVFHSRPKNCNGYALDYNKKISLVDNQLIIDYHLTNTGSKSVQTEEYCHNFVHINNHPIGPAYSLDVPFDIKKEVETSSELTESFSLTGNTLTWSKTPQSVFYFKTPLPNSTIKGWWELIHKPTGVGMKEQVDFAPDLFALWGEDYVVSPELFKPIDLKPGETMTWQRIYTFFS